MLKPQAWQIIFQVHAVSEGEKPKEKNVVNDPLEAPAHLTKRGLMHLLLHVLCDFIFGFEITSLCNFQLRDLDISIYI